MSQVVLISSGEHQNIPFEFSGPRSTQLRPVGGYPPPRSQWVRGDAVDVSAHAILRLVLEVSSMVNTRGDENGLPDAAELHVALEHSPDGTGGWSPLAEFAPMRAPGQQRRVISDFEGFVRVAHYFLRPGNPESTERDGVTFTFSVTGDGVPDAA